METHLPGKVRLRIAGDLHHYTRHTPVKTAEGGADKKAREAPRQDLRSSKTYTAGLDGGELAAAAKKIAR